MKYPKIKIHNYRRCPYCIRVRILLELENIPYEVIEERMRNWTDEIKDLPRPCVPILNVDGELKRESNEINKYLNQTFCENKYSHKEDEKWFIWCDENLKPAIDQYKYGNPRTREFTRESSNLGIEKLHMSLQVLEEILTTQKNLGGEVWSLADFAIIPFIRQIMRTRNGEFDFSKFPKVKSWTKNMLDQNFFEVRVMKKYPFAKEK